MAWFPCNIGGGSSEIANILKGTAAPSSLIGENGQLYLKTIKGEKVSFNGFGQLKESSTMNISITKDEVSFDYTSGGMNIGAQVYKQFDLTNVDGIRITVKTSPPSYDNYSTPRFSPILLIENTTNPANAYPVNTSIVSANGETYRVTTQGDTVTFEADVSELTGNYWIVLSSVGDTSVWSDLYFLSNSMDNVVCDSFAKVNNQWQNLIGTDIDDIQSVVEPGGEIKTLVYTLEAGGQWETFSNPSPDNGTLLYEVKDSNGDIVLSVKKKTSDLPIYNAYVALGVFDTNKTINAARSSDNSTIYLSVNTTFTGYSLKAYTFEPGFGNATVKRGSFVSASTQYGIVDVDCGFKPDLVLVSIPFGNNDTTSYWEKNVSWAGTKAIWNLYPAEHTVYVNDLGRTTGETGIQQINDDGFSFMSNGANTRGIACKYIAVKYEPDGESAIADYATNYFPCLLYNTYHTIFSKSSNDEIYNGGRGGTRASSNPVFYFCCKTTSGYWGYGLVGLASASVQITATTSYGGAEYYTQTTTNGDTVYLARLGAMIGGQSSNEFKNGSFEIDIDGSQYVEQDGSTWLFNQTFVDAAYEALTALS